MEINPNFLLCVAHSIVFFTKEELSPGGIVDDAINGDPDVPSTGQMTAESLGALAQYMPVLAGVMSQTAPVLNQTAINSARQTSGPMAQLSTELFKQFAPVLSRVGNNLDRVNANQQAKTNTGLLKGNGLETVKAARAADEVYDPEYFASKKEGIGSLQKMNASLDSIPDQGLSGGERAEIERSVNRSSRQTGNADSGSQIETVGNAMTFGGAARDRQFQKIDALNKSTQTAAALTPGLKSNVDTFKMATGRTASPGMSQYTGVNPGDGSAGGLINSLMGNIFGANNQRTTLQAGRRDTLDRANETMSSL